MKKQCCRIRQRIWNNLYSVILRGSAKGVGSSDQTCMTSSHPVFGYSLNACSDVFLYHGLFQWFILLFLSIGYASAFRLKEKKHSLSLILVSVVHIWPLQDLTSYQRECTDGESGTNSHVLLLTLSVQAHYSLLGRPRGLPIPAINISII